MTHKRTKRQPAIAAGLNAPRRNRVGRQHGWPADVPSAEQRRAQRQRDLEAIRRAYAEMVATSHEIDDDTADWRCCRCISTMSSAGLRRG